MGKHQGDVAPLRPDSGQDASRIRRASKPLVERHLARLFKGLSTGPDPYGGLTFGVDFDFVTHELKVSTSEGGAFSFALEDGLSVADFYKKLFSRSRDTRHGALRQHQSLRLR